MNWITKIIKAGEKIKTAFHERATKEDIAKSDWTSCCRGPILKKADGLVVGSAICKEISNSIKKRQNPVTNVTNIVKRLKNKIK